MIGWQWFRLGNVEPCGTHLSGMQCFVQCILIHCRSAANIVKCGTPLHRGELRMRSAPGKGTQATILLPAERIVPPAKAA